MRLRRIGNVRRKNAKRDANESGIIAALEAAGARVEKWDKVDLIVGFRGRTILMEVTNPEYEKAHPEHKEDQRLFREEWPGEICEVRTQLQALRAIGAA